MSKRMYWGLGVLIILIIGIGVFFIKSEMDFADLQKETEKRLTKDQAFFEKQQQEESEHSQEHDHVDGTFHGSEHDNPLNTAPSDWTPSLVKIPEGITAPDVKAAWERLDYISKNRHQWGNFSPRALELMEELTPLPEFGSAEYSDCGEEIIFVLEELAELRDPRSAELLVSYQIDSPIWGRPIDESLAAMGPASVPALIAGLNPERAGEVMLHVPIDLLPQIVEVHRSELDGIVEHIIIPRLVAIASPKNPEDYELSNKMSALEALARFQKPKN